jgi:2-polyprenyl-3-methyl-5-hydroxy-6-metoxy-1,4-benzoquinol methylase
MLNLNQTTKEKWKQAQDWELDVWMGAPRVSEDWNHWWLQKFQSYTMLKDNFFPTSLLEVGCGPYGKNTTYLTSVLSTIKIVDFLDPLLHDYLKNDFLIKTQINHFNSNVFSTSLEELETTKTYDCILCINVLDHVFDASVCMNKMFNLLNSNGLLILGQDLTNQEDLERAPYILEDVGHPIKLDHLFFKQHLKNYKHVYQNILTREQGRNPDCHYGTLLYIGQKRPE